jgi:hypothetical protein
MGGTVNDPALKMRKPPTIFACVGTGLLYGTVSSMLTFSNKALTSAHNFNFPLFVLFTQVALNMEFQLSSIWYC